MKKCLLLRNKDRTIFVKVSDDWYPNCPNNTVAMYWDEKNSRISLWGDDDFGMEKFNCTKEEFLSLKDKTLSVALCKKMGFINA